MKTKIQILILLALLVVSSGFGCQCQTAEQAQLLKPVELTWWGSYDDPTYLDQIIADYHAVHPNITITYRKLQPAEFETQLLNALAEDRGPDIFSIQNTWITKYLSKIEPLPASIKMAYQTTQKSLGLKEETIVTVQENPSLTGDQLKNTFLGVVYGDVVRGGKIYGLPLSIDTLALFYNRDLLNNAGIPLPPNDYVALQADVKHLTYQDKNGNLVQAGVALGTSSNVERSADILSLLMMQNGAEMVNGNSVIFGLIPQGAVDRTYNPGLSALQFYTDFANPAKDVYTWNDSMPNSIDAFAQGRAAMVFAYNYDIPYLEATRAGKLNYGIAAIPQITGRTAVNFANYWVQTVSKKSQNINEAWDFVQFIAKETEAKKYLDKSGKLTALRSLVATQQTNDSLKVFADQLLTAKSWYLGNDAATMENAFKTMIYSVNQGGTLKDAIELATQKVQQTY